MTVRLIDFIHELPRGCFARETLDTDVDACTEIVRNGDVAACGETTTTREEVASDIQDPIVRKHHGTVVITHFDKVVAMLNVFSNITEDRSTFFDLFIEPSLDAKLSDAIALCCVTSVEEFTRSLIALQNLKTDMCKTALYENDHSFIKALQNRDFEYHRTLWRMSRPITDEVAVELPSGYELRPFRNTDAEWAELSDAHNQAFVDYYDFKPLSEKGFREVLTGGINDSSLWRMLYKDDVIVGYCMPNRRFDSEGYGYIGSIGVLREHRSRGLAKAMLNDAFNRDKAAGYRGTILHGDSTNPTGAMKLYENLGMRKDRVYVAYRKVISTR